MAAKDCNNLISHLVGELSEMEEASFREHLSGCQACQLELNDLQETWNALSYDRNEIEAPPSLKADVMEYVFTEPSHPPKGVVPLLNWPKYVKKSFTPLTTILVAVLLIGVVGLLWHDLFLTKKTMNTQARVSQHSPIQIQKTYILNSNESTGKASGMAYLIQDGNENKLVMLVNHLSKTEGEQTYQAWLFYEGSYYDCGTFRPNQNGEGVLTYKLPPGTNFDEIEVTLEPGPNDRQPQGQTVMKTL